MCDADGGRALQKPVNGSSCRQSQQYGGGGGGGHHAAYAVDVTLDESLDIIKQQCQEIYELRAQLNLVMSERDMLLAEVGRLKFDMELYDQRSLAQDASAVVVR